MGTHSVFPLRFRAPQVVAQPLLNQGPEPEDGSMQARQTRGWWTWATLGLTVAFGAGCAMGGDGSDAMADWVGPDGEPLPLPTSITTEVEPGVVRAGERVPVRCWLHDADGEPTAPPDDFTFEVVAEPAGLFEEDDDGLVAVQAGEARVRCGVSSLGLVDTAGVPVSVVSGPAVHVVTQVEEGTIVAGQPVDVGCRGFDLHGNEVDGLRARLAVSPKEAGVEMDHGARRIAITRSGEHRVSCLVTGAESIEPATLWVVPALPATLDVAVVPDREVYRIHDQVSLQAIARDVFGNRVDEAHIDYEVSAGVVPVSTGRFRLDADGFMHLGARVTSATFDGRSLASSTRITVNTTGPSIECMSPGDGVMLHHRPGQGLSFEGRVADTFGIQSVTVDGQNASLGADGWFQAPVATRFGMNFVEVVATDSTGMQSSRVCSFMVSDRWVPEDGFLDGGATLEVHQRAVDDGNPAGMDSLNDFLHSALNSTGLRDAIDHSLGDANPLMNECVRKCFIVCVTVCARVDYDEDSLRMGGPNGSGMALDDGGLRLTVSVRDIEARAEVSRTCRGTPRINVGSIEADVTFNVAAQGGQLRTSVRTIHSVSVDDVDFRCRDLNLACSIGCGLFKGKIRDAIQGGFEDMIRSQLTTVVDGLLSDVDVGNFGSSFDVAHLDGSGTTRVDFGMRLASLGATRERLTLAAGTRFTVKGGHARPSLGVALPPGPVTRNPTASTHRPVVAGVHAGVLNHALHALWRGGFFDVTLAGEGIGDGMPSGVSASVHAPLPPITVVEGGRLQAMVGGLRVEATYPGLFDDPIAVGMGGVVSAHVTVVNGIFVFGDIRLDALHLSTDAPLTPTARQGLESLATRLLSQLMEESLHDALPSVPMPGFVVPPSMEAFGLPGGERITLVNPVLDLASPHFVLGGSLGVEPMYEAPPSDDPEDPILPPPGECLYPTYDWEPCPILEEEDPYDDGSGAGGGGGGGGGSLEEEQMLQLQ
jgi:hypothetical protein